MLDINIRKLSRRGEYVLSLKLQFYLFYSVISPPSNLSYRTMSSDELIVLLSYRPKRKRYVHEFDRQFKHCTELATLTVTAEKFWVREYHLRKTLEIVRIVRSIYRSTAVGPVDIRASVPRELNPSDWEGWFRYYQWEMLQGVQEEDED